MLTAGVVGVGILYNEEELKKNKLPIPKSWADLNKPEYVGRLGITAPQSSMGTAALVMLARINGGGEKNIEPGFVGDQEDHAEEHDLHLVVGNVEPVPAGRSVDRRELANIAPALRAKGLPIRFSLPTEGSPTANTGMSMVKGAPCEAAAYEYMNLYFSDEFQAMRMAQGALSASKDAWSKITPELRAELGMGPEDLDKFIDLDWRAINEARPGWIERWTREIK